MQLFQSFSLTLILQLFLTREYHVISMNEVFLSQWSSSARRMNELTQFSGSQPFYISGTVYCIYKKNASTNNVKGNWTPLRWTLCFRLDHKLRRLGFQNWIIEDSDSKPSKFERPFQSDLNPRAKILISFRWNSITFDTFLVKTSK